MTFSAAWDPWIETVGTDGRQRTVSVRDALVHAHRTRAVLGDLRTAAAVRRVLLAVLHRAVDGPRDAAGWLALRRSGRADPTAVDAYLNRWPMYDLGCTPGMVPSGRSWSGLRVLYSDLARHGYAPPAVVDQAEATRWAVRVQAFDLQGIRTGVAGDPEERQGRGMPRGPGWCSGLDLVEVHGPTLWHTLTMAATPLGPDTAAPAWERGPVPPGDQGREVQGRCDLLTWQARRVALVHDQAGQVVDVLLGQGDRIEDRDQRRYEHQAAWRVRGSDVYPARIGEPTVWQAAATLWPDPDPEELGPGLLRSLADHPPDHPVTITVTRVQADRHKTIVEDVDQIMLPLPGPVLADPLRGALLDAAGRAAAGLAALGRLAGSLTRAAGGPLITAAAERDAATDRAVLDLDRAIGPWVADLTGSDPTEHLDDWCRTARTALLGHGDELVSQAGSAALVGRVVDGQHVDTALAERRFRSQLRRALGPAWRPDVPSPPTDEPAST